MKKCFLIIALTSALSFNAFADMGSVKENLKKANKGRFADSNIQVLREVPIDELKGFYEVKIGGQSLIVDESAKYAIIGDVYNLDQMINISHEYRNKRMSIVANKEIKSLPESSFVTYKPEKPTIGTLYVYSDPTCGYCKKLHSELDLYMNAGVEVKYIPYPRGGAVEGNSGFEKLKQIMCADDQQTAMTKIKGGADSGQYERQYYDNKCVDLVKNGVQSGQTIGLSGTPYLYLSTGQSIPGYQPADAIIDIFNK